MNAYRACLRCVTPYCSPLPAFTTFYVVVCFPLPLFLRVAAAFVAFHALRTCFASRAFALTFLRLLCPRFACLFFIARISLFCSLFRFAFAFICRAFAAFDISLLPHLFHHSRFSVLTCAFCLFFVLFYTAVVSCLDPLPVSFLLCCVPASLPGGVPLSCYHGDPVPLLLPLFLFATRCATVSPCSACIPAVASLGIQCLQLNGIHTFFSAFVHALCLLFLGGVFCSLHTLPLLWSVLFCSACLIFVLCVFFMLMPQCIFIFCASVPAAVHSHLTCSPFCATVLLPVLLCPLLFPDAESHSPATFSLISVYSWNSHITIILYITFLCWEAVGRLFCLLLCSVVSATHLCLSTVPSPILGRLTSTEAHSPLLCICMLHCLCAFSQALIHIHIWRGTLCSCIPVVHGGGGCFFVVLWRTRFRRCSVLFSLRCWRFLKTRWCYVLRYHLSLFC